VQTNCEEDEINETKKRAKRKREKNNMDLIAQFRGPL
jgi:hypothetical protein